VADDFALQPNAVSDCGEQNADRDDGLDQRNENEKSDAQSNTLSIRDSCKL